jgi:hypothetical protein
VPYGLQLPWHKSAYILPARNSADRDVLCRPISASRVTLLLGSIGIIIIIIIHIPYFTTVYLLLKQVLVSQTKHFLFTVAEKFLTIQHVLSITAFFIRMYRAGHRLSSFILLCNLCWIICIVCSTNDIIRCCWLPCYYLLYFQVCILLELLSDGAMKFLTVRNGYIC